MSSSQELVRVIEGITDIDDPNERYRLEEFSKLCLSVFQCEPEFIIRAPGRINLIGDHIDYHGFSVLPMAINNSILLGLSTKHKGPKEAYLEILNRDINLEPFTGEHSFSYGHQLDKSHKWHYYVLCGYHGVMANQLLGVDSNLVYHHARKLEQPKPKEDILLNQRLATNMRLMIDSNLPQASGLSSSSALVCASAVATSLYLSSSDNDDHGKSMINGKSMASNCAKFEHLIGTHGGGMDQAAIMTAQEGYAKYVEFMPEFKCTNVQLPDDVEWLVSHCGINYPKASTSAFNARVLETKLAAAMISKAMCKSSGDLNLDHTITLGQVKEQLFPSMGAREINKVLEEQIFLDHHVATLEYILSKLEMSQEELVERFKTSMEFITVNGLDKRIYLLKRCQHIFNEAERVEEFRRICDLATATEATTSTKQTCIRRLGELMNESHRSLSDKYHCGHKNLDKVVRKALKAGALGARLTGAGWGGCVVTLVESNISLQVQAALEQVSKFTFKTEPSSGCTIIKVA